MPAQQPPDTDSTPYDPPCAICGGGGARYAGTVDDKLQSVHKSCLIIRRVERKIRKQ
jgi:hypothetical protein